MLQIQKTKDYDIFKKMEANRPLDPYHLKRLKATIEQRNELEIHPIIVNKDYCVIDGQHRLQTARDLGLDIYYIKSDSVDDMHIVTCNANQKSFDISNFINYFAVKEKKAEYIEFKRMMKQSELQPKALISLLLGVVSAPIIDFLKTGRFQFPKGVNVVELVENFTDFMAYCSDKRIKPKSMFSNYQFTRAFRWLYRTTGFEKEVFYKKLDNNWFKLKPQRTAEDWYQLLIEIYNHKNRNGIEDEFTKNVAKALD